MEMGDSAVIDFEGSTDGKPISEIAPQTSKKSSRWKEILSSVSALR